MSARNTYYADLAARRQAVRERVNPTACPRRTSRIGTRHRKVGAFAMVIAIFGTGLVTSAGSGAGVHAAPVGQGFTVTASDVSFILAQIKIAENHTSQATPTNPCAGLLGTGLNQIPSPLIGLGLRTVDGSCNNLQAGQETFGAADQTFPRLTTPQFNPAEPSDPRFGPPHPTSYAQKKGLVFDTQPRLISNLIVDQTATNPAAIAAAARPPRTQGGTGTMPCTSPGVPANCIPAGQTLPIPNVTTDVGLSPPFNSLFTIFGQFFDHGLDKITNGGSGTVFVPLRADDPLIIGPDGIAGTADDPKPTDPNYVPPGQRFMVLTRSRNLPGPDGIVGDLASTPNIDESADDIHEATNTDTPWVDLSQAYGSHSSHQVFLREYVADATGRPQSTGYLLDHVDLAMATWADVKTQSANLLGLKLVDTDVTNIPMIAADPYGNFIPGAHGLPQYVTKSGLIEGNLASPVPVPSDGLRINTAFLNDIAHSAAPVGVPDPDSVAGPSSALSADCGTGPSPCYDNELLDLHVIAGDGRANENIGLTAIHTIFEHEHNRLVSDVQNILLNNPALLTAYQATGPGTFTYGERLFQVARFITEMEYQHLVFEEFARKVQPAITPFARSTAGNAAITAEFAHAVYRFGHSMLTETIPRTNVDGTTNDIPLLDGFLNPVEFKNVTPGDLAAAGTDMGAASSGAIVMGLSNQAGSEIDEFVTNTLRDNLLGLPLDLASLNIARARSEGIPSLNNVRKQIFAQTNDGQLTPYTDWVDFGMHLKHPESLINFVAAYGGHPSILNETTIVGKRNAARAIVNPIAGDVPPGDAADFMFSTGTWANTAGGVSSTGLDNIDLWIGGLAESTNTFGGLLGSTFNYVFEKQMTTLQDNDRLYYLNRTPGMNLSAQLEGNSFAELVMRNTTATSLKGDAFATADCKFEIANLTWPAASGSFITGIGSINDDPTTTCNENRLLIRMADGQIRYRPINSVNPPGINGQSVFNGTDGPDRIGGGSDTDTIMGNGGNDILQGNGGNDQILGGEGNDIITDTGGDDILKGGPGNDAIDGGIGNDLILGGDGNDVLAGGAGVNNVFGGPGDDFIMAGQGADVAQGDSGDDWIQGGDGSDLLYGDSASPFFDDHNTPGNDVLIGQAGDDTYIMEGGDDIAVAGPGVEKVFGGAGYDWSTGVMDPLPQDADLNLPLTGLPLPLNGLRDRFNEVEALSGGPFNDILRGDNTVPERIVGRGPLAVGLVGCDALDQAGVDRISGLAQIMPALTTPSEPIVASAATYNCPLTGLVWGQGNILLGGGGSDILQGRGGNDIIDGDRYLNVRISVRTNPADPTTETGTTDLLEHAAVAGGSFGPGTAGMTLQQAVFAGLVDPGNMVTVREILTAAPVDLVANPTATPEVDTALYEGAAAEYDITPNANGSITVAHNRCPLGVNVVGGGGALGGLFGGGGGGGAAGGGGSGAAALGCDGIDTLFNIENLQFADQSISVATALINKPATGTVTFSAQPPAQGVPLTVDTAIGNACAGCPSQPFIASITDPNGFDPFVPPVFLSWQANTPIGFAPVGDGLTFTPTTAEVGFGLRVVADFIDFNGNPEEIQGPVSAPVTHVNHPATGAPVITPTAPQATFTVSADLTSVADVDGLPTDPLAYTYQWQADGVDITGAGASTFTPDATMVGSTLTVIVGFTDLGGTLEVLTSAVSAPILAPPAAILDIGPSPLNFGLRSNLSTGTSQSLSVGNIGNIPLNIGNITLTGAQAAAFVLTSDCANLSFLPTQYCTVSVTFASAVVGTYAANITIVNNAGTGADAVIPVSVTVVQNTAPTGAPALSTTAGLIGTAVTATIGTIADADGLIYAVFGFQWQQGPATGATGPFADVAGATDPTFTPTVAQQGRRIRMMVSFIDDIYSPESVAGSATAIIGGNLAGAAGDTTTSTVAPSTTSTVAETTTTTMVEPVQPSRGPTETASGLASNDSSTPRFVDVPRPQRHVVGRQRPRRPQQHQHQHQQPLAPRPGPVHRERRWTR